MKKSKLFDLLIKNSKKDINNYLMENGKSPKLIRPIQFDKKEKGNSNGTMSSMP